MANRGSFSGRMSTSESMIVVPVERGNRIKQLSKTRKGSDVVGVAAIFLMKLVALEGVRRASQFLDCPGIWRGIQALPLLCFPPFKWLQRCIPFKKLITGIQMFSGPLFLLSVASSFPSQSDIHTSLEGKNINLRTDPEVNSQPIRENSSNKRSNGKADEDQPLQPWLLQLYEELERRGVSLPERIDEDELNRFYHAANGDFAGLLSRVEKATRWRENFRFLAVNELEMWSNLVFWHGLDLEKRPCLIVRLGFACINLSLRDRPAFVQAVISQVEYGLVNLAEKNTRDLTVLVDCDGITPLQLPMQMVRSCASILVENYPNHLGQLFIIRLPPVVRVICRTFLQVLKPSTRKRMKILGKRQERNLVEQIQPLAVYVGGKCNCKMCSVVSSSSQNESLDWMKLVGSNKGSDAFARSQMLEQDGINECWDQLIRTALLLILMTWIYVSFLPGLYSPT